MKLRAEDQADDSVLVDHVGHPSWQDTQCFRDTERASYRSPWVTHQEKRQPMLGGESTMALQRIATNADDLGFRFCKVHIGIAKRASLRCTNRRAIARIKKQHYDVLTTKVGQGESLPVMGLRCEVGCVIADSNARHLALNTGCREWAQIVRPDLQGEMAQETKNPGQEIPGGRWRRILAVRHRPRSRHPRGQFRYDHRPHGNSKRTVGAASDDGQRDHVDKPCA